MRLLDRVPFITNKAEPYTAEEIDNHESSARIWATIVQCKREAQEMVSTAYERGLWEGRNDRQ